MSYVLFRCPCGPFSLRLRRKSPAIRIDASAAKRVRASKSNNKLYGIRKCRGVYFFYFALLSLVILAVVEVRTGAPHPAGPSSLVSAGGSVVVDDRIAHQRLASARREERVAALARLGGYGDLRESNLTF